MELLKGLAEVENNVAVRAIVQESQNGRAMARTLLETVDIQSRTVEEGCDLRNWQHPIRLF